MAGVTVNVNSIDSSAWSSPSGAATDIDEAIASADGSTYSAGADSGGSALVLGFGSPGLSDSDTITQVDVTVRTSDGGSAGNTQLDVELLIGGSTQGTVSTGNTTGSLANYGPLNTAGWNSDWSQTQLDGLQVRLTPTESGMPGTNLPALDCVDVDITYTPPAAVDDQEFAATRADIHLGGFMPKALSTYIPYGMRMAAEAEEVAASSGPLGTHDGGTAYLNGLDLAASDGTQLTWGMFFKPASTGSNQYYMHGQNGKYQAIHTSSDTMNLTWLDSAFATKFNKNNIGTINIGEWNWFLASIDTADSANSHLYLNDSAVASLTINAGNFDFGGYDTGVFATNVGASIVTGGEGYFFYINNDYVDISVLANRRKYVNADGTPNLSGMTSDGSGLTGTTPLVFLRSTYDLIETNAGSAGNYTKTNTFTEGSLVQ